MHGKTVGLTTAGAALLALLVVFLGSPPSPAGSAGMRPPPAAAVADLGAVAKAPEVPRVDPERQLVDPAAGPSWPLVVAAHDGAGRPLPGVRVEVCVAPRGLATRERLPSVALREAVATGVTGADGEVRCSLDDLRARSVLFRELSLVYVDARHPGGNHRLRTLGLPRATAAREFREEVELEPGVGMTGRVVDRAGDPVVGAQLLRVMPWSPEHPETTWSTTDTDGRFSLPASTTREDDWPQQVVIVDASQGSVVASVPAVGELAPDGGIVDLGTLVVDCGSVVRGQVVLGDGSPLADYPVIARSLDPGIVGDPEAVRSALDGTGKNRLPELRNGRLMLTRAETITARDGSFAFAGVPPEQRCVVGVRDAALRFCTVVARPDGEPVRLVVDRQLLELDVRSQEDESLIGASVFADGYDPAATNTSWDLRPGFPATGQQIGNAQTVLDRAGRHMLLSPFGWIWRIGVHDEAADTISVRHEAMVGLYRAERTLVLRPALQFGALHLTVVDQDGRPSSNFGFYLRHLERDVERNLARLIPPADDIYRDLPAGRWQLTVLLGRCVPEVFGMDTPARGVHEQEIVIRDSRTTKVRVVSPPAGRVAFRLHAARPPASGSWQGLKIQSDAGGVDVPCAVHSDDQRVRPWPLDTIFYLAKAPFPPGRHGFLVTVDGYQPAHCEVEVVDDHLATARVELLAR